MGTVFVHDRTLSVSNDCSTIGYIHGVVQSGMRDPTGEVRTQMRIGRSLILKGHTVVIIWYATTHDSKLTYLMTAYTPNDRFTANDASFYNSKVG